MVFNISKENTTLTEADFAVDFLCAIKGVLFIVLFVIVAVCFLMWEVKAITIRLFVFLLLTSIGIHFVQGKYIKVLQEHLKDRK